jgi:hypothetical protein
LLPHLLSLFVECHTECGPRLSFHRAAAAVRATSERFSGVSFFSRAFAPRRPSSTAALFFFLAITIMLSAQHWSVKPRPRTNTAARVVVGAVSAYHLRVFILSLFPSESGGTIIALLEGAYLLDSTDNLDTTTEPSALSTEDWELGFRVLGEQLASNRGSVSTVALRRELERKHHIEDPRPLLVALQFFDAESARERGTPVPTFRFRHLGRSFYSEERYAQQLKKQEQATEEEAEGASREASSALPEEIPIPRANRQEEAAWLRTSRAP